MTKLSLALRLENALEKKGWKTDPTKKGKYIVMTHDGGDKKAFIGRNGALRFGKSASASRSVTDTVFYKALLCGISLIKVNDQLVKMCDLDTGAEIGIFPKDHLKPALDAALAAREN